MRTNRLGFTLVAACIGLGSTLGFAQTTSSSSSTAPTTSDSQGEIQEVVVTAQRRSQRLQDVPIDVAVVSGEDALKMGVTDSLSLPTQVPGLATSRQITGATIYLRGVGTIAAPGNENGVATYIDDVYVNGYSGSNVPLFSVDHVEVLKGPQGTLFGRNATGGVISITTKEPSETPELDAQIGYGNYRTYSASVYGTMGIAPHVAIDFAYEVGDQKTGWGHDLSTGQEINRGQAYSVRSKVKWTPDDATSVIFSVDHHWDDYDFGINPNVPPGTLSLGNATYAGPYNSLGVNSYTGGISGHGVHVDGYSLTAQHDFDWGTIKSITARRESEDTVTYDQDMGPIHFVDAFYHTKSDGYSEELHLSSPAGFAIDGHDLHWLTGLYVYKNNDGLTPLGIAGAAAGGLSQIYETSVSETRSYAGFVDATYAITPVDHLTAGLRYTDDRIINNGNVALFAPDSTTTVIPAPSQYADAKRPTYRLVLDHNFSTDIMAYLSAATAFKSGGFNQFSEGTPAVRPETLDAFTVGLKSDWLDRKLQVNLEAFDYKYLNQQVAIVVEAGQADINAAESRIYGLDANVIAKLTPDFTLNGNFEYLRGRYGRFEGAPEVVQTPATCEPYPMRLPGALVPGSVTCSIDVSGRPTIRSPAFSGNISGDYVFRTNAGNFGLNANYYYTASYNWDPSGQYPEPAYGLLSSYLDWTAPSTLWNVSVYCSNCLNRYHDTFIAEGAAAIQRAPADPRLFGIRFAMHLK